ncbi:MAG: hypothetical protein WBP26_05590 [Candidatus Saccharimonadales bacterium]
MDEQKPGDVIVPNATEANNNEVLVQIPRSEEGSVEPENQAVPPVETLQAPPASADVVAPEISQPQVAGQPPQPVDGSVEIRPTMDLAQYPVLDNRGTAQQPSASSENLSWTASEFIHHAKSLNWYLVVGIVGLLGAITVYFLTKDIVSSAVIAIVAIIFAVSAASKPRVLPYEINAGGIQIGSKHYPYADFKTFSVVKEGGAFSKVELMPLKRFSPPVSMHIPPEEEESIVHTLSEFLPYEERKPDVTDRLLNKIRF